MNHKACVSAVLLAAAGAVCADVKLPTLKVGNEVFTNVTVLSANATDIHFIHARGMGNAKLKNVEPEVQKRFGYDPVKAGDTEKAQQAGNAAYRSEVLNVKPPRETAPAKTSQPTPTATGPADIPVPKIHAKSFRNRPAPPLTVEKWLTAQPNIQGKFLLVDFWATWCGPCRRSIPALNALHQKFKDRLVIVGLSDESESEVRQMTSPKTDYFVAIDTSGRMRNAVEVRGIPHAMLMDPKGIVRFEGHPGHLSQTAVAALLEKYSD